MSELERCRRYVAKMPPAIQGQGGRGETWKAVLAVAGFQLANADAWTVACEYNARCLPPWPPRRICAHAQAEADGACRPGGIACT